MGCLRLSMSPKGQGGWQEAMWRSRKRARDVWGSVPGKIALRDFQSLLCPMDPNVGNPDSSRDGESAPVCGGPGTARSRNPEALGCITEVGVANDFCEVGDDRRGVSVPTLAFLVRC